MKKVLQYSRKTRLIVNIIFGLSMLLIIGYIVGVAEISKLQDFSIIVVGIIIQAFPFLLMGTIISSLIGLFVSDEIIVKFFPEKGAISILSAIVIGVFIPLCDCAVIPVAGRLRKKGVPIHAVVTFIMGAPIVNPIVILSTIYAFPGTRIYLYRVIIGVVIAMITGVMVKMMYSNNNKDNDDEILVSNFEDSKVSCSCGSHTLEHNEKHCCSDNENHKSDSSKKHNHPKNNSIHKVVKVMVHSGEEFLKVSKLFIIGVFITSGIQVFIPKSFITGFAGGTFSAIFIMMIVAFIMSICSTSDSFIARSFTSSVPMSGILGFVVFGPVLDLKNAIMMTGFFKKKFVFLFVTVAFITAFIVISISSILLFK